MCLLISSINPCNRCHYSHFIEEELETEKVVWLSQGHTINKCQKQNTDPDLYNSFHYDLLLSYTWAFFQFSNNEYAWMLPNMCTSFFIQFQTPIRVMFLSPFCSEGYYWITSIKLPLAKIKHSLFLLYEL